MLDGNKLWRVEVAIEEFSVPRGRANGDRTVKYDHEISACWLWFTRFYRSRDV
jgi:hypothetical protein